MSDMSEIMTVKQVAENVGWHPNTVYLHCKSGDLPSLKLGRNRKIRKSDYLEWLKKMEVRA